MNDLFADRLVLLVDDDADSREAIAAVLEFHGAAVLHASDGAEALERLRVLAADAIITEITMPRMPTVVEVGAGEGSALGPASP